MVIDFLETYGSVGSSSDKFYFKCLVNTVINDYKKDEAIKQAKYDRIFRP
jgi:hypothetical protein